MCSRCANITPQAPQVGQEDLIPAVESQPGSEADQIQDKLEAHLAEARPEGNPRRLADLQELARKRVKEPPVSPSPLLLL